MIRMLVPSIMIMGAMAAASQNPAAAGQPQKPPQEQRAAPGAVPAASPAVTPAAPSAPAKKLPQAKTQAEYQAYQAVAAETDPALMEKAAEDFAAKYPDSDLKSVLYQQVMFLYQNANNADKTLEMGHKVLAQDPDSVLALIMTATVLSERTRDSDLDKDERFAEASKNAGKAIANMDTGFALPPNFTSEQAASAKALLLANAYSALGTIQLNQKDDAGAEKNFTQAVQLNLAQPDPLIYLRLAIAQDHQKKYSDALTSANKAVQLSPGDSPIQPLAKQEQARLTKLVSTGAPPASPPTPAATVPKS